MAYQIALNDAYEQAKSEKVGEELNKILKD